MTLLTPTFEFVLGRAICVHIPHAFHTGGEVLENELLKLAQQQGKRASVARPPGFETVTRGLNHKETSEDWLARVGGISKAEAKEVIADLGIWVAEKVAYNAGTPRALLGIAATLINKPDVIMYTDSGLDPEGRLSLHRFVTSKCQHLSVVHVSYPSTYGDGSPYPRNCPANFQCIELTAS